MTFYNYTISSFHDFGCQSDPIILLSSKSGCLPAHSCQANAIDTNHPYAASSQSCSADPISFVDGSSRDYVIKSLFPGSEDCSGLPETQYVVAADYACHPNPLVGHDANQAYFQVSCTGGSLPTWNSCLDKNCQNCTAITATSACMLGGAGTSNGYKCYKATPSTTTSTFSMATTSATTSSSSTTTFLPTSTSIPSEGYVNKVILQIFVVPLLLMYYMM